MDGVGGEPKDGALISQTMSEGKSVGICTLAGEGGDVISQAVCSNEGTEISSKHSLGYCTGDGCSLIGEK